MVAGAKPSQGFWHAMQILGKLELWNILASFLNHFNLLQKLFKVTLINILNVSLLMNQISPVETRSARKQLSDNYTISQGSPDTAHHGAGSQAVATNKTSLIASLQNVLRLFLCFRQLIASTFWLKNIFEKI